MHPDNRVEEKVAGVTVSNGIGWDRDAATLYYVDTPTFCVFAFDYDVATGAIARRRVAVRVPEPFGAPDGMTLDTEGMLWVAHWGGGRVCRWNPGTGACLSTVRVPAAQVTSCAFGGEHLDQLFITTARQGLSAPALSTQPLAGGLFCCAPGVQGLAPHCFAG